MGFLSYIRPVFAIYISCAVLALLVFGTNTDVSPKPATTKPPSKPTAHGPVNTVPQVFPEPEKTYLPLFTINYPRVQIPFEITLWVLLASFAKIGFHVYHKITIWVPETCLLIAIGLIVGAIMYSVHEQPPAVLTSSIFFLYMLPPIVLDSAYFMPTQAFFENMGTVLWFSIVGTLWNSIGVGISLYGVCQIQALGVQDINLQENLLFASIISAVDPVAVLTVFEDVNIHEQLYIVVFGESLFNDAVTVVLYNLFNHVAELPVVDAADVLLGVARFFLVGLGGILFGFVFGFVAAFTTRFTKKVREIEPLFIFMYSYLAYLLAELISISSIMAIVTCALTMKYYVEENVSQRSCTTIRHVIKMLGTVSETLIFFFLGVVTITTDHEWNWGYILFTLLFAQIWRGLGIVVLTQIINPFRTIPFNFKDQFGLAYGGLRGAITFALVYTLPDTIVQKKLFVTATIVIIIFTVFIQGVSIRPIIELMNVRKTNRNLGTINVEIHSRLMEHIIAGVEDLCGQWSHHSLKDKLDKMVRSACQLLQTPLSTSSTNVMSMSMVLYTEKELNQLTCFMTLDLVQVLFMRFNNRYIRKILIRDDRPESSIVALYKKLELQNAMEVLDTISGDISAAPSLISLHEEKTSYKSSSKPKKTFLASDLIAMHEILSKNMYKIRERTVSYTNKHALPNDSRAREILVRRHTSIRRSLRARSFQGSEEIRSQKYFSLPLGRSLDYRPATERFHHNGDGDTAFELISRSARPRSKQPRLSSSRAMRLDPLREMHSVASVEDEVREEQRGHGPSLLSSSSTDSRPRAPHQRYGSSGKPSIADSDAEAEEQQPESPPPAWTPEPPDQGSGGPQNPLLRRAQWKPQDQ